MIMKKYIVCGGEVISKNDEDRHYIYPIEVCELYGLDPKECFLLRNGTVKEFYGLPKALPVLRPRSDGDYWENSPVNINKSNP